MYMADTPFHTDDNQNPEEAFESIIKSDDKANRVEMPVCSTEMHLPARMTPAFEYNVSELPGSSSDEDIVYYVNFTIHSNWDT